jgi:hypothetical protein
MIGIPETGLRLEVVGLVELGCYLRVRMMEIPETGLRPDRVATELLYMVLSE